MHALRYASLPRRAPARVLACGAFFKNSACLIEGDRVIWSAPHGDLGHDANRQALRLSLTQLAEAACGPIHAVAHDLHPDFYSSQMALILAERLGVPAIAVQHHHAHIAVAQAEHGIDDAVIGLALDGVGLGSDGMAWGGEILWVDTMREAQHWQRLDHLALLPLPGGDIAVREPWRMAAGALHMLGRGDEIESRFGTLVGVRPARQVHAMLQQKSDCPYSSSGGRWFDAAAGALGLSVRQSSDAEAAMLLEQYARDWLAGHPDFYVEWRSLDLTPLIGQLFELARSVNAGESPSETLGRGAAIFHLALANALAHHAIAAARIHGVQVVVLGGGCFLNRILCQRMLAALADAGLTAVQPRSNSCCDASLALGQAWIAACTIQPQRSLHSHHGRTQASFAISMR